MGAAEAILAPEAQVLLGTVRWAAGSEGSSGDPPPGADGTPPPDALDWGALHALLVREGAAAALHPVPERLGLDVPSPWDDRLRALGAVAGFHQRGLLDVLEDVVERLSAEEIPVCLLKGAALALTVYPHPLGRPMGDLDLLVPPGRALEAWDALREAGWIWHRESHPMEEYGPRQHLPPLEDPGRRGRIVEVHDDLFIQGHPFRFGPRELTASSKAVPCGSTRVSVPGPASHLVYTCIHFAWSHCLGTGGWRCFRDVQALTSAPEFRWSELQRLARESRAERACYWTLRLARALGGVRVPGEVLAALEPASLPRPVLRALERHFSLALFSTTGSCPSVLLGRALWRAAMVAPGAGRGGVRPWEHDRGFVELRRERSGSTADTVPRRLVRHARDLPRWLRYLAGVVGGGRVPSARPPGGSRVAAGTQRVPSAQAPGPDEGTSPSSSR